MNVIATGLPAGAGTAGIEQGVSGRAGDRRAARGLIALLIAVAAAAIGSATTQAATIAVCASGCAQTTLSAGIATAAPGDTISVGAGTYTEQVVIGKSLTLAGAGAATTTIRAPGVLAGDPDGSKTVVLITGPITVELSGFTIRGPASGVDFGIYVRGNAVASIHDNVVKDIRDEPLAGSDTGVGIQIGQFPYGAVSQVGTATIARNIVVGYQKVGIAVENTGSSATVTGNTVTGAGPITVTAQNGIQLRRGATGAIRNNVVTGNAYDGPMYSSFGIGVTYPGPGVVVQGNTVNHNSANIYCWASDGVQVLDNVVRDTATVDQNRVAGITVQTDNAATAAVGLSGIRISGNTVQNNYSGTSTQSDGIDLYGIRDGVVSNNTIAGSSYDGILVGGSHDIAFTGNRFSGNGLLVSDPSAAALDFRGIPARDWSQSLGNGGANPLGGFTVRSNSFTGNRIAVRNYDVGRVDATSNWFGTTSGPGALTNVTTIPWCTGNDCSTLSSSADLTGMSISSGALSPAFSRSQTSYAASVGNSVASITLTVTAAPGASAITSGGSSLTVGSNTVTATVTAADGTAVTTYVVAVTRAAAPPPPPTPTPPPADTTAPTPIAARASGAAVVISFSEDVVGTPPLTAFTLAGAAGGPRTPIAISVSGPTVTLGFASGGQAGEPLTASFSGTGLADGAANPVAAFTTGVTNGTAPFAGSSDGNVGGGTTATGGPFLLTGAYANSGSLILTFSHALATDSVPVGAFWVNLSVSGSQVPTSVSTSGSTIALTLATAVLSGETVLVSYTEPATGALSAVDGSLAVPFVGALATNTTVGVPAPAVLASAPPRITTISPNDGLTVSTISQVAIVASKSVAWSDLAVERPDGTVVTLSPASGTTAVTLLRSFGTSSATATGSYSITGTMNDGLNPPVAFRSSFTLYTRPIPTAASLSRGSASSDLAGSQLRDAPPVERLADPAGAGALVAANGWVSLSWPARTFPDPAIVKVDPVPITSDTSGRSTPTVTTSGVGAVFAAGGSVVEVTATRLADGAAVTVLGAPLDIEFPNASATTVPSSSSDGLTWTAIPLLPGTTLPVGQRDGAYRDSLDTIHILTRHLTYFGVLEQPASAPLEAMLAVAPNPYLAGRRTFGFLVRVTRSSTVSAVLRSGTSTLMTWPAQAVNAGTSVLKQPLPTRSLAGRTAILELKIVAGTGLIRLSRTLAFPKAPAVLPARPAVLLVNGTAAWRTLQVALETGYEVVAFTKNADSFRLIADPLRHIDAVVVDLRTTPTAHEQRMGLIRNLRFLFPSLRIVVATNSAALRRAVVRAGADTTIPTPVAATSLRAALASIFPR